MTTAAENNEMFALSPRGDFARRLQQGFGAETQIFGVPSQDRASRAPLIDRRAAPLAALDRFRLAEPLMRRDDLLFWLSIAWLVLLCSTMVWALVAL